MPLIQKNIKLLIWLNVIIICLIAVVIIVVTSRSNSSSKGEAIDVPSIEKKLDVIETTGKVMDISSIGKVEQLLVLGTDTASNPVVSKLSSLMHLVNIAGFSVDGQIQLRDLDNTLVSANRLLYIRTIDELYISTTYGKILRIATDNFQTNGEINIGGSPTEMVAQEDGRYLFAVNPPERVLSVINIQDLTLVKNIKVRETPEHIAIDAAGEFIYLSNPKSGTLTIVSVDNLSVISQLYVGGEPGALKVFPGKNLLLFLDKSNNQLKVLDQVTNRILTAIDVVANPSAMIIDEDHKRIYVLSYDQNVVGMVDLTTEKLNQVIKLGSSFESQPGFNKLFLSSNNLIITNRESGKLYRINLD